MNKSDLVTFVASTAGLNKVDSTKAVDSVLYAISKSLSKGEAIRLVGFGTFFVVNRAETLGRNPRTGELIKIPATKFPKFKAGKALKAAVAI